MTNQELRDVLHAEPFRAFTIHLTDGRKFRVRHRDFVLMPPTGRTFVVYDEEDGGFDILDLYLVTGLEVGKNGASKKQSKK